MPHEDGPLYHLAVTILSLHHPAVVRFARKRDEAGSESAGSAAVGDDAAAGAAGTTGAAAAAAPPGEPLGCAGGLAASVQALP
jgi:hypothetical protein